MILHIPHSGTDTLGRTINKSDINNLTDWFTDELFVHQNSDRLVQKVSRFVCDCERFPDDIEEMFLQGQGICYTKGTTNNKIEVINKEMIISKIYNEHHKTLNRLTKTTLSYIPKVVIVDCHSFTPKYGDPDFCIGVNMDTPSELIDSVVTFIKNKGFSSEINHPFSNSIVPSDFNNDDRVISIMIEVNKELYLDTKFKKNKEFYKIQRIISEILEVISEFELSFDN